MGAPSRGGAAIPATGGRERFSLPLLLVAAVFLLTSQTASAAFHQMKIREVYPGSANDSYLVLQMLFAGENFVGGHDVALYDAAGGLIDTFAFAGGVPNGSHGNNTILVGDSGVQAAFGMAPDLVDADFNVPPSGGAACWSDGTPPDCVAWGNFTGDASLSSSAGNPESPGGVTAGRALHRSIASGCPTYLESADDTDDSATDFSEQDPNPRNNATSPTETLCVAPNTTITSATFPNGAKTNNTGISFEFSATPSAGATFECALDSTTFSSCSPPQAYSSLDGDDTVAGTLHTFRVRARNADGTDPTPAMHSWTVDTVDPTVTITAQPADPSAGTSASFSFSANESATFQCRLEGPDPSSLSACNSGKTYTALTDGSYTFKVRATDAAGNEGVDDTYAWTVDNFLSDTTPPVATIVARPPDPSQSSTAMFTYSSNEPGSTFECKLDGGAFAPCAAGGVQYTGLANGPHAFQVRATDTSLNQGAPAGYSWSVAVPDPTQPPQVLPPPPPPPPPLIPTLDTQITRGPGARSADRTPTFAFRSTVGGAAFQCKLDRDRFRGCRSPLTTKRLAFGRHVMKIRARAGGKVDPTPARRAFKVVKKSKRGKKGKRKRGKRHSR